MNWYVVYTKPRYEKKVAEGLEELGVEVYCPLLTSLKQYSDRKKKVKEPLFKSYVFVRIEEEYREDVFQVHGIVRYLFWLGKPAVVRDEEIEAIRGFLNETEIQVNLKNYVKFEKVDILHGPFKGMTGEFLYKKKNKLTLRIESLGTMIQVEIQSSQVSI